MRQGMPRVREWGGVVNFDPLFVSQGARAVLSLSDGAVHRSRHRFSVGRIDRVVPPQIGKPAGPSAESDTADNSMGKSAAPYSGAANWPGSSFSDFSTNPRGS